MIAIVDYDMGNVASIKNMFKRIDVKDVVVTSDPEQLNKAEKLVLPGVGAFDSAMEKIGAYNLKKALDQAVLKDKKPILGICLGMQIMTKRGEEGTFEGLGWIDAEVKRFKLNDKKVPHMGWNTIEQKNASVLFDPARKYKFYFVHSYYVDCAESNDVAAVTGYGITFHAAFQKENVFGVQFHPEKSHRFGMDVFERFAKI